MSPNVSDLKDSKYLSKEDCGSGIVVTIAGFDHVDVSLASRPTSMKYILNFEQDLKPMVLNNTNGKRIEKITGSGEFSDWIGKQVVLYNDEMVEFGGELVGGIRVRPVGNGAASAMGVTPAQQQDYENAGETVHDDIEEDPDIPF